jgi:hypothetical protein
MSPEEPQARARLGRDGLRANWGTGTRRLAALAIADSPITLEDEIERGLEPY